MSNENNNKINIESTEQNGLTQKELDSIWLDDYKLSLEYKEEFGHLRFPKTEESRFYLPKYKYLYDWAEEQAQLINDGNLSEWKNNLLLAAGFDFIRLEKNWNENIRLLLDFITIYGHSNVSRYDEEFGHIANYFHNLRPFKEKLSQYKVKQLDDLGFDWSNNIYLWDMMYKKLKNFYKEHGYHFVIKYYNDPYKEKYLKRVNKWCAIQRYNFIRGMLPLDKIKLLDKMEFDFQSKKPDFLNEWEMNLYKLQKYQIEYGNFYIQKKWKKDLSFAKWFYNIIENRNTLPNWQINGLIQIGFDLESSDAIWEHNYQALIKFKERYGHYDVKSCKNGLLWQWVDIIRKARSGEIDCYLPEDRIEKLDSIGFVWEPLNYRGLNQFNQLIITKSSHFSNPTQPQTPAIWNSK
jgi:hypothetical protein